MRDADLSQRQLDTLHELLETQLHELGSQLENAESAARPVELDQQSVGRVSRIDAIQQQQMALANREQAQLLAQRIRLALQRIEEGSYGDCLRCGAAIAFARLEVQPYATLCLDCQAESETRP